MATEKSPTPATPQSSSIAVRLSEDAPNGQPLLTNYSNANVANGLVLLDFGFLEPAMLAALSRAARAGDNMPKSVNGRLAARLALTPDAARGLHQQLQKLLSSSKPKASKTVN